MFNMPQIAPLEPCPPADILQFIVVKSRIRNFLASWRPRSALNLSHLEFAAMRQSDDTNVNRSWRQNDAFTYFRGNPYS